MLKTAYEEIVNVEEIGNPNTRHINDILPLARREQIAPAERDEKKVLLLGIDIQNDFMEGGSLGVPGSREDIKNVTTFIYRNIHKITRIAVSLDTHQPMQIFHPDWWMDELGRSPDPFTIIKAEDVSVGKWVPKVNKEDSLDYCIQLEKAGKKELCIWPYHCIEGTFGSGLEGQFANMIYFHSLVRKTEVKRIIKGLHPTTEMYGIFRPEYSKERIDNIELLKEIAAYDQIIVAGEAKSHCVLESVAQLIEYFERENIPASKIYILEDCMSSIPGYEQSTEEAFQRFKERYGIHLVSSKELEI